MKKFENAVKPGGILIYENPRYFVRLQEKTFEVLCHSWIRRSSKLKSKQGSKHGVTRRLPRTVSDCKVRTCNKRSAQCSTPAQTAFNSSE